MNRTTKRRKDWENPMMYREKSRIVKQKQVNFVLVVNVRPYSPTLKPQNSMLCMMVYF